MINKNILRALKVSMSFLAYIFFILAISSTILSRLPIQSLSQSLGVSVNSIMSIGFAGNVIFASIFLSILIIKLKLKITDAIFCATLLALYNFLMVSEPITANEYIESTLLFLIPIIIIIFIFKYKNTLLVRNK